METGRESHSAFKVFEATVAANECLLRISNLCVELYRESEHGLPTFNSDHSPLQQDGYFLPFYFQAVQSKSATQSGIRFISLAVPEVVAIVIIGAVVTKTGHYVFYSPL